MPPLTPKIVAAADCAGEGVTPLSPLDGASRRLAYSGKLSASYDSTASVQHRIELGAGLYRERQRNHWASLRAKDTRP